MSEKTKSVRREIIEWAILLSIPVILYVTGLHTMVASSIQRVLLWTNIIQPDTEMPKEKQVNTTYNFSLLSLQGKEVHFSEFKGKVVFLNLWATWCAPCIAEMPNIHSLYQEVDVEDIAFVMLNVDQDINKAVEFINEHQYTFPVYRIFGRLPQAFHTNTIPTTFVISPEGKIVSRHTGMANYNIQKFKDFLDNLAVTPATE